MVIEQDIKIFKAPRSKGQVLDIVDQLQSKYPEVDQKELHILIEKEFEINISELPNQLEDFPKTQEKSKEIIFTYEDQKPLEEIKSLEQLEVIINGNFPSIWFETKACLSAYATLALKNLNGCPSLNLIGNPSGEKTTCLSFFYNSLFSYNSDDFTPKSFVSHSANIKPEQLEKVDLLPKIKDRVLITPELAPLFESCKDDLVNNFAMLTRVLDGEGLNRDSGTHGHRGYSGDYKFVWLGASTPLRASVWNLMGKIGNRLFFLNMRDKARNKEDYLQMFQGKAYEQRVKECRGAVKSFLKNHFEKNGLRSLEWDAEQDLFILQEIIKYAQLLAKLRGTLMLWKSEGENYQYSFPIIEEPPRAINSLYNLAKGHALIHGRTFLKTEDLKLVREVAFSSMPLDRYEFLKLLVKHEGRLTTSVIQSELSCSDETARKTMKTFEVLGVVTLKKLDLYSDISGGRPMYFIEIKPEFYEIFKHTHSINDLEKSIPTKTDSERGEIIAPNLRQAQGINDLEKPTPTKTDSERGGFNNEMRL